MPRPAKLDGTDLPTKLLGTLVHWVMCNNRSRRRVRTKPQRGSTRL